MFVAFLHCFLTEPQESPRIHLALSFINVVSSVLERADSPASIETGPHVTIFCFVLQLLTIVSALIASIVISPITCPPVVLM